MRKQSGDKRVMQYSLTFFFDQTLHDKIMKVEQHLSKSAYSKFDKPSMIRDAVNTKLDEIIKELGI